MNHRETYAFFMGDVQQVKWRRRRRLVVVDRGESATMSTRLSVFVMLLLFLSMTVDGFTTIAFLSPQQQPKYSSWMTTKSMRIMQRRTVSFDSHPFKSKWKMTSRLYTSSSSLNNNNNNNDNNDNTSKFRGNNFSSVGSVVKNNNGRGVKKIMSAYAKERYLKLANETYTDNYNIRQHSSSSQPIINTTTTTTATTYIAVDDITAFNSSTTDNDAMLLPPPPPPQFKATREEYMKLALDAWENAITTKTTVTTTLNDDVSNTGAEAATAAGASLLPPLSSMSSTSEEWLNLKIITLQSAMEGKDEYNGVVVADDNNDAMDVDELGNQRMQKQSNNLSEDDESALNVDDAVTNGRETIANNNDDVFHPLRKFFSSMIPLSSLSNSKDNANANQRRERRNVIRESSFSSTDHDDGGGDDDNDIDNNDNKENANPMKMIMSSKIPSLFNKQSTTSSSNGNKNDDRGGLYGKGPWSSLDTSRKEVDLKMITTKYYEDASSIPYGLRRQQQQQKPRRNNQLIPQSLPIFDDLFDYKLQNYIINDDKSTATTATNGKEWAINTRSKIDNDECVIVLGEEFCGLIADATESAKVVADVTMATTTTPSLPITTLSVIPTTATTIMDTRLVEPNNLTDYIMTATTINGIGNDTMTSSSVVITTREVDTSNLSFDWSEEEEEEEERFATEGESSEMTVVETVDQLENDVESVRLEAEHLASVNENNVLTDKVFETEIEEMVARLESDDSNKHDEIFISKINTTSVTVEDSSDQKRSNDEQEEKLMLYIEQDKALQLEQEKLIVDTDNLRREIERVKQVNLVEAARLDMEMQQYERLVLEKEKLAFEADYLRQEVERIKEYNLAEATRLDSEWLEGERVEAPITDKKRLFADQIDEDDALVAKENLIQQDSEQRNPVTSMMDLVEKEISGIFNDDGTLALSKAIVDEEKFSLTTTVSFADANEASSWQIASSILGDEVIAEGSFTLPILHIGNRVQSSSVGTTHESFLFQTIDDDGVDSSIEGISKIYDDGYVRFRITPCISKRPWSMSELIASVPTRVLAYERNQWMETDTEQKSLEKWELDDKAARLRRYYEVEIHIYQKFERKREFLVQQRRRIKQQQEAETESGIVDGVVDDNVVAVPKFLKVYLDDGSGGPNDEDAIPEYGTTGTDVWGKTVSKLGGSHEWLVYEGRFESEITLLDALEMKDVYDNNGVYHHLCGIQRAMNLPETYGFGDVLDIICRSLLEDLVFLSSCNIVHRDLRFENIVCDGENQCLRLTNFGNALDLDPPRIGLDNDNLRSDAPGSIANTLAADVFSVALIICRLLFNIPDIVLNKQLKSASYDLDLWLQQALAATGSDFIGLVDALDYLTERRGLWGLFKSAMRPNPLRKKITMDSLRLFNEVMELKNGGINWTEERKTKITRDESFLEYVINQASGNAGGTPFVGTPFIGRPFVGSSEIKEGRRDGKSEVRSSSYDDDDGVDSFDITRVPYTLQPPARGGRSTLPTKATESVLSKLSKETELATPRAKQIDEVYNQVSYVSKSGDYTDITRLEFTPLRKSSLTDMLVSYASKRSVEDARTGSSSIEYDTTLAYFDRVSQVTPQQSQQTAYEVRQRQESRATAADALEIVQILAPPGKLGVEVDAPGGGRPIYVSSINQNSPLLGQLLLGDVIVAVDDTDVQKMEADDVCKILLVKFNARRVISVLRTLYPTDRMAGAQVEASFADDDTRINEVEQWLLTHLPTLSRSDALNYCTCLIDDGFDSMDMLSELEEEDISFMKKAHKRVILRKLFGISRPYERVRFGKKINTMDDALEMADKKDTIVEEAPNVKSEQKSSLVPPRKVYTVDEALGVAARKGIEATIAEQKRLTAATEKKGKEATSNNIQEKSPVMNTTKLIINKEQGAEGQKNTKNSKGRKLPGDEKV